MATIAAVSPRQDGESDRMSRWTGVRSTPGTRDADREGHGIELGARWFQPPRAIGLEFVLAILALLGGSALFLRPMWALTDGTLKIVLSWAVLGIAAAALLWWRSRLEWLTFLWRRMPSLLFVTLLALVSTLWSLEPTRSAQRGLWLLSTTLVGVCIGYNQRPRSLMAMIAWVSGCMLLLSIIVVLAFPDTGLSPGQWRGVLFSGAEIKEWRGIFLNKNEMGALASATLTFFLVAAVHGRLPRVYAAALAMLSGIVVVMSGSATAAALTALSLLTIATFTLSRRVKFTYQTLIIAALLAVPAWLFIMLQFDMFTGALNRDPTMTSRTQIWQDALVAIRDAPLIGHGYHAVWVWDDSTWFPQLRSTKLAAHAHNGYLQVAADLGVPAAFAAAALMIWIGARSFDVYVRTGSAFAFFCFVYTVWFMVFNVTETRLFQMRRLDWIIFVALAVAFVKSINPARPTKDSR